MNTTIPQTMQAVILEDFSRPPTVEHVPVPNPGPGQVLIHMAAAPINPSDLGFLQGAYRIQKGFPVIPGFEGSGTVVAAGPGLLSRLWLGRRVACSVTPGADGSWAEYMLTGAASCIPLPGKFPLDQGAMLTVNPLTALAFFDFARRGGHRALVSNAAAGALGKMILRLGQTKRIPIIHLVRRQEQVRLLASMGARYVLDISATDFTDRLRTVSASLGATLILDPVAGKGVQQLLEAAPDGSTLLNYGALSGVDITISPRTLTFSGKRIEGFFLAAWAGKRGLRQNLMDKWRVRRLASNELRSDIHKRFPLSAADHAVGLSLSKPTAGKVLIINDEHG